MQTPMLITAELNSKGENCSFRRYNNLCIRFGTWKVWRPESKSFLRRLKVEFPGRAGREQRLSRSKWKRVFLIDSDAKLFMCLIQYIRFGSWKVRRLNRALPMRLLSDVRESTLMKTENKVNIALLYLSHAFVSYS